MRRNSTIVTGRPRRPLATSASYAIALLIAAMTIGLLAIAASWEAKCPQLTGLDKGIYIWPPGAQCVQRGDVVNHQEWPWAPWAILGLVAAAGGVLLFGLVVTIRELTAQPGRVKSIQSRFPGMD